MSGGEQGVALELHFWFALLPPHPPCGDVGLEVILSADRLPEYAPEQRQLAGVRERVSDRALKEFLDRAPQRLIGCEVFLERVQRGKEAIDLAVPEQRFRVLP